MSNNLIVPTYVKNVASVAANLLGAILMVVTYSYIQKLENIDCPCAEHPHRKFIKGFLIFSIIWLVSTMFVPPTMITNKTISAIYASVMVIYGLATFVFFVIALRYVQFLMKEKCQCSEDVRRDVLYYWSIIEIALISITILLPVIVAVVLATTGVIVSGASDIVSKDKAMTQAAINPLKTLKKVPGSLRKTSKMISKRM
jgi:hypothetical protein